MKIFVLVDLEGASGVVSYDRECHPGAIHYEESRENLMSDLNSAIEGAVAGGAGEIVVYDMHYWGLNVMMDKLGSTAKVIRGKPKVVPPENGLDQTFAGLMMVGLHAKAQTPDGLLTHTYDLNIKDLSINGLSVGEIGMETALAGEMGVPLIFVSGDAACLHEARSLAEKAVVAVVKEAVTDLSGLCLPTAVTARLIKGAAQEAVQNVSSFRPYTVDYPVTVEVDYYDENKAKEKLSIAGVEAVGPNRVAARDDSLRQAWIKLKPE